MIALQRSKMTMTKGQLTRIAYTISFFVKEMHSIADYYHKKKSNKSAQLIHEKIMGIDSLMYRDILAYYHQYKKSKYMIKYYHEQIDFLESRMKYA